MWNKLYWEVSGRPFIVKVRQEMIVVAGLALVVGLFMLSWFGSLLARSLSYTWWMNGQPKQFVLSEQFSLHITLRTGALGGERRQSAVHFSVILQCSLTGPWEVWKWINTNRTKYAALLLIVVNWFWNLEYNSSGWWVVHLTAAVLLQLAYAELFSWCQKLSAETNVN